MSKRTAALKAFGAIAILIVLGVWAAQRADAIIIINNKPAVDTGTFGISAFDIVRVHIANVSSGIAPCVVEVRFYGPRGELLESLGRTVAPGESGFVDYSDTTLRPPARRHLRARVTQDSPPPDDSQPIAACAVTTEVVDNRSGQALFIIDDGHQVR